MRLHTLLLLPALFSSAVFAVFADDAYHTDYHLALVGKPQQHATFFQPPYAGSKASLLYTLSKKNVLAAINPKDGAIVWRQLLTPSSNSSESFLTAGEGSDTVISAVDGQIAAWSSSDGRLAWEKQLGLSKVKDVEIIELEDGKEGSASKDAILLSEGEIPAVTRFNEFTGNIKWRFEDNSGDAPFQVSTSATTVFYISHHGTFLGGYKTKITSLSPVTGEKLDSYTLSSDSELSTPGSVLFAGANTASPLIVWTDKAFKTLKINIIGTKGIASFNIENKGPGDIESISVHAPSRITSLPQFLVQYQTSTSHWAEVYHVDIAKSSIAKAYDLPKVSGKGSFSTSTVDANVYFTRVTVDEVLLYSSASNEVLGRWSRKLLAATSEGDAYPVYGVTEAVVRSNTAQAVRSAILFSNGDWSLILNGETAWTRPEALSGAAAAAWADLPEEETLAQQLEIEGHQNVVAAYVHRVLRHVKDLEHLPAWVQDFPNRLLASFTSAPPPQKVDENTKDTFGFRKLVVVATEDNRLIGIDTGAAGNVLWNIDAASISATAKLTSPQLETLPNGNVELSDPSLETPVIIAASTGAFSNTNKLTVGKSAYSASAETVVEYAVVNGELRGYTQGRPSEILWQFKPFKGESIKNIASRPAIDPVASIGKVLGDRRVLYKYLNPNLILVSGVAESSNIASFYLLDSVSGNLLYAVSHDNVDTSRTIASTISENWLAYSFTIATSQHAPSRGHQLAVAEFYESSIPDDRGPLAAAGNASSVRPTSAFGASSKPYVVSQTYHIAEEISHMSVSHTKQGITSRVLLVVLPETKSIVGIPRQIIDPRRPVGRDPTALEASEGLVRYVASLEFDPKWYLNHQREVFGIENLIAAPSSLESTSLIFSYGIDIFGTRVAPSFTFDILGKDFNKVQMLLTVVALGVGVLVVAPLVRRKQIDTRWRL